MTTTSPVILKGNTSAANLSTLKSIEDLDTFMSGSSAGELNAKFLAMVKEFQGQNQQKTKTGTALNKTQRGFSLSQILVQSLQNGDKQMLEMALCVSSAQHSKVLQVSLMRLPGEMVLPLLEGITKRLTLKPRRAMHLLPWLKNLLLCHGGYLSTIPEASKMLAPLQQSIEERTSSLNSMQKLGGRLEMILKQAELREGTRIAALELSEVTASEEALVVYDESESETEIESGNEMDERLEGAISDMEEDENYESEIESQSESDNEEDKVEDVDDEDDSEIDDEDEDEDDYE